MHPALANREIILGVTGSIAAYKACDIASRLTEAGATVRAALTQSAQEFVGAVSFEGITGNSVITSMFDPGLNPEIEHIALAKRASAFLIAPATANIIAKMAHGLADDWLSTTLLATRAPIVIAPAMNTQMYSHVATQENIATLKARGCIFVGPDAGQLACGDVGAGRLIDTPAILEALVCALHVDKPLRGKKVLITSGGNHEPIDPVRFIGNRSSGKMGHALALEALRLGAEVTVVTGPHSVPLPHGVETVEVQTAHEMLEAVEAHFEDCAVFIGAAAVADYRVERPALDKHKHSDAMLTLSLVPNPDIAASVSLRKRPDQITVGFAAETSHITEHAQDKLKRKHLDLIVANEVGVAESGFGTDTDRAWLIKANEAVVDLGLLAKTELAQAVFNALALNGTGSLKA